MKSRRFIRFMRYLYVADKYEGLILVNAATLLDGDPLNNYLKRRASHGIQSGWRAQRCEQHHDCWKLCVHHDRERALAIVSINDPLKPRIVNRINLKHPRAMAIQFRYAFVVDEEGLKVIDVTVPEQARIVEGAFVPLAHAHDVYVARTYAYVANGKDGIAIIDVERPERRGSTRCTTPRASSTTCTR